MIPINAWPFLIAAEAVAKGDRKNVAQHEKHNESWVKGAAYRSSQRHRNRM